MNSSILYCVFFLFHFFPNSNAALETNCTCGTVNKEGHKYPFLAGVYFLKTLACGGVIVTKRHILTTMTCMEKISWRLKDMEILVGGSTLFKGDYVESETTFKSKIKRLLSPPDYYILGPYDDIALLVTKDDIPFSDNISPICLPKGKINFNNSTLKGIGWGILSSRAEPPHKIADGEDVNVYSNDVCKHVREINKDMKAFCIQSEKQDACRSVKGGPLVYLDASTNKYFLGGLGALADYHWCGKNSTAIATDVTEFIPWIQETISRTISSEKTCSTKE